MKCSVCGSENLEGSAYCEDCGSKLVASAVTAPVAAPAPAPAAAPVAVPAAAPAPVPMAAPAAGAVCPSCGAQNNSASGFCEDCGASLAAGAPSVEMPAAALTAPAPAPAPAVVAPAPAAGPKVVLSDGTEYPINLELMLLGRNSPADGIYPEIDLTPADPESYVSRRHGELHKDSGVVMYQDLASSNGSFLNGNRLQPNVPIELHDGDCLRLGRTEMTFRA